ncbi:YopX family protein [Lysinibacillus sp. UGB7]|uniref:YopX family protein n=1 Tax=Lysinibacillus sp. UGB7 TaxID=3411039 RepID=UPI003B8087E2
MSREIKFRAWVENESVKSGPYPFMNHHIEFMGGLINDIFATSGIKPLNPLHNKITYMQYTGLKDKHGKEIFEGDIVQFKSARDITERYEVEYTDYGEWGIGVHRLAMRFKAFEVIGNIYENLELLEGTA